MNPKSLCTNFVDVTRLNSTSLAVFDRRTFEWQSRSTATTIICHRDSPHKIYPPWNTIRDLATRSITKPIHHLAVLELFTTRPISEAGICTADMSTTVQLAGIELSGDRLWAHG